MVDDRHQIQQLPPPSVMRAFGGPHAAKIEPDSPPTTLDKGACQRLHHLVVHGSGEQRMRMGNDNNAPGQCISHQIGQILQRLNGANRT